MPTIFKNTLIFEGRGRGWTESYWYNANYEQHERMEGPLARLAQKRANLLGLEARIKAYRISKEAVSPDAHLVYTNIKPEVAEVPLGNGNADLRGNAAQQDVALLFRCADPGKAAHKFIYARGIPDRIEAKNGLYEKDFVFDQVVKAFVKELATGWGWMGVNTLTKKSKIKLINYESNPKGIITFNFQNDIFPAGLANKLTKLRLAGVNKKSPLNGVHIVRVQDTKVASTEYPFAAGPFVSGGYGSWSELTFIPIDTAIDQKIVSRKAGAPLLESRGREADRARF